MKRPLRIIAAAAMFAAAGIAGVAASTAAHADTQICEQYGVTTIQGRYVVMNNRWGTTAQQCINVTDTGFAITTQQGVGNTSGAPVSYPAVYVGCHYTRCSPSTNLPLQVSQITSATSSINYTYVSNATYDAAYDIWLDPTPKKDGVSQMEIMIWFNRQGSIQPIGSVVGNATVGGKTWEVWRGSNGANNVISYVAPSAIPSWSFSVLDFINDVRTRGAITNSWYLTSIQAGFEPWIGGAGLAVNSFTAEVNGNGQPPPNDTDTQAPTAPTQLAASSVTANSAALTWSAASDNKAVTGYDVYRQQAGGTATLVGSPTGTSYTATGLSPATSYTFSVRAKDAAGNVSPASATVAVTTQPGDDPGDPPGDETGACKVNYTVNQWNTGFTAAVTITNTGTSPLSNWSLTWSYPGNQQVTNAWNATVTQSGSAVTARSVSHNSSVAPGGTASFGFQASYSGTNQAPTSYALNGAACTVG